MPSGWTSERSPLILIVDDHPAVRSGVEEALDAVLSNASFRHARDGDVLYNFTGGADGGWPTDSIIRDPAGHIYGTTSGAGKYSYGVVFKLH